MKNLDKFSSVSESELAKVNGGDNADYNMGYETGRDVRRGVNHFVKWWDGLFH
ncbi:hypothetical protein [Lactobacillus sp. PSON]|uniref:hypothetical protein n=1 Tax=Lactobacillus sp. PSON TaxID=3455454 RepID=UPI004042C4E8